MPHLPENHPVEDQVPTPQDQMQPRPQFAQQQ